MRKLLLTLLFIYIFIFNVQVTATTQFQSTYSNFITDIPYEVTNIIYSEKTDRLVYEILKNGRYITIIDNKESKPYDLPEPYIDDIRHIFSPDGKQVAYIAKKGKEYCAVLNGIEEKVYKKVRNIQFSPDSKTFAYEVYDSGQGFIVVNGIEQKKYEEVDRLKLYKDGYSYYCFSEKDYWKFNEVNTTGSLTSSSLDCWPFKCDEIKNENGETIAKIKKYSENDFSVIFNNRESKKYERINLLTLSPDHRRFAFFAFKNNELLTVIDGIESNISLNKDEDPCEEGCQAFQEYKFSPNSKNFAFIVMNNESRVVLNDRYVSDSYISIKNLTFSNDSNQLAYRGANQFNWPGNFVAINGFKDKDFHVVSKPIFLSNKSLVYFAYDNDKETIYKVVIQPK